MTRTRRAFAALVVAVALLAGIGLTAAQPAAAATNAYGTVQVFNFGGPLNSGVGIVTQWTSPNTWQYIIPAQRWTLPGVKGAYVGSTYCLDVYYSWDGGRTWYYQWTGHGPEFVSFPGWQISWVGVYPYKCW